MFCTTSHPYLGWHLHAHLAGVFFSLSPSPSPFYQGILANLELHRQVPTCVIEQLDLPETSPVRRLYPHIGHLILGKCTWDYYAGGNLTCRLYPHIGHLVLRECTWDYYDGEIITYLPQSLCYFFPGVCKVLRNKPVCWLYVLPLLWHQLSAAF